MLLVEHHMAMVMAISDKVVVLDFGSQDRRGHARARSATTRGSSRRTSGRRRDVTVTLLEVDRARAAGYGAVRVLHGLDFTVDEGEVVVILGANGAGKTTTLRALSGMIDARGRIAFDGQRRSSGGDPSRSRAAGIAHVPQGRGTIADLTVDENLRLGAYPRRDREVAADIERWYDVFPRLAERRDQQAGQHERRRAADARDRAGADGAAEAGAARRAVARARADRHAGAVPARSAS